MSEKVLVFPASILDACNPLSGFSMDVDHYGGAIFMDSSEKPFFRLRSEVETDESVKQIIPYIIIRLVTGGEDKYLVYQRTKKGGEERLFGNLSIGVGGHVNDTDQPPLHLGDNPGSVAMATMLQCIRREIAEELEIELHPGFDFAGAIYDPSDAVGRVHFGFVIRFAAKNGNVKARDEAIHDPHFVTVQELKNERTRLEGWSRLIVDTL
jgi:predicted NUDIX family phosphoesterase